MSRGRLRVAVIQGGPSSEAEVSRASASGVAKALTASGHDVVRLELDGFLAETLRTGGFDVVFPVVHGAVGEDGSLQGLLEVLALPYVGSGVLPSAMAMNKAVARRLFAAEGIPIAPGFSAHRAATPAAEVAARARRELPTGLVVKPAESGSAIGIGRFPSRPSAEGLEAAIAQAYALGAEVVVEAFVPGREVTCGVLEIMDAAPGVATALPPTEIRAPKDAFYTFQARYAPGRSEHVCPAELGPFGALVQALAVRAHRALACRDLSRVDFVVGDREADVVVLEVNTLPGLTPTSLLPEEAAAAGLDFGAFCTRLVVRATERGPTRRNAALPFPGAPTAV
ncbi:MAG: D-alanine--D-alanine ligase [Polyangiaceae bacterium]